MRSRIFVLLVLASPPAIAEDELDIPGIDSTRLRGDALVWEDATFHLEPWNGGVSFKFVTLSRRSVEVGRAIPVRIVDASMRGFVEVTFPMRSTSTPAARGVGSRPTGGSTRCACSSSARIWRRCS
ncbi:MAG: hypothetical protein WKG01_40250 [Kofleriaceae bacterium]